MTMKEHMPYKADTTRLRKKDAKHVSAAILKLMVKITSIFGSYDTEVLYEVIPIAGGSIPKSKNSEVDEWYKHACPFLNREQTMYIFPTGLSPI